MQGNSTVEPRSVTPEVAGSSPVAPASSCRLNAGSSALPVRDDPPVADPGNGPGQRLVVAGHRQTLDLVCGCFSSFSSSTLRWGDGLGGPSSHREYRDGDRWITTGRVRLATLSRSRPCSPDEPLSACWTFPERHAGSGRGVVPDPRGHTITIREIVVNQSSRRDGAACSRAARPIVGW